jgi:putative transposase
LDSWIYTAREVYNKALEYAKKHSCYNFMFLRNRFVTKKVNKEILARVPGAKYTKTASTEKVLNPYVEEWECETPKDIRAESVKDIATAYKAAVSNVKRCNIKRFDLGFKSRKLGGHITLDSSSIKRDTDTTFTVYRRYIKTPIRAAETLPSTIKTSKLIKTKDGFWYICIPIKIHVEDRTDKNKGACALDPGVRTFQTLYSEEEVAEFTLISSRLQTHDRRVCSIRNANLSFIGDKYYCSRKHASGKLNRMRKKARRLETKLTNQIKELHSKTINYITKKYKTIFLPSFESQELARKGKNRTLHRDILRLSHYKFKQALIDKCNLIKGCSVKIVSEAWTTKTCTKCGTINDPGSSKHYACSNCSLSMDRDVNAARNIFIRSITV